MLFDIIPFVTHIHPMNPRVARLPRVPRTPGPRERRGAQLGHADAGQEAQLGGRLVKWGFSEMGAPKKWLVYNGKCYQNDDLESLYGKILLKCMV